MSDAEACPQAQKNFKTMEGMRIQQHRTTTMGCVFWL